MRSNRLTAVACAAGIAVVVAGSAVARTSADRVQLRALMTAADEVPAPSGAVASARGTFVSSATKTATGATLSWTLTFSNLTGNAVAAHIHTGPRGQAGPVSVALCGPCTSGATGTADITSTVLSAIQSGGAYINVHTPTNPAGEIRAQLGSIATVRPVLNTRQEIPKPKGAGTRYGHVRRDRREDRLLGRHHLAAHVRQADRPCRRRAHSPRQARCRRRRRRRVVRPLPERQNRPRDCHRAGARRARVRPGVRERPHAAESRRRDPRSDPRDPADDHAVGLVSAVSPAVGLTARRTRRRRSRQASRICVRVRRHARSPRPAARQP